MHCYDDYRWLRGFNADGSLRAGLEFLRDEPACRAPWEESSSSKQNGGSNADSNDL